MRNKMKARFELIAAIPALLLTAQAQAAIPVSGFTIEQASRPYGLIALAIVLAGLGLYRLKVSR